MFSLGKCSKFKFGMILIKANTFDFMVELPLGLAAVCDQRSECIPGHTEHMKNGVKIISLKLALENKKFDIMITDEYMQFLRRPGFGNWLRLGVGLWGGAKGWNCDMLPKETFVIALATLFINPF